MTSRSIQLFGLLVLALCIAPLARNASAGDAAQLQAGTKMISGTVLTVEDAPAAGVDVQLFSSRPKTTGGPTPIPPGGSKTGDAVLGAPDAVGLQKPNEKPFKTTKADSAGKFTFSAVPIGKYIVVAGTGRNVAKANVELTEKAELPPLTLKLPSK
ncbi:hypothetical protein BH09PLA1_BH09PLA1_17800 [soil metagenome]